MNKVSNCVKYSKVNSSFYYTLTARFLRGGSSSVTKKGTDDGKPQNLPTEFTRVQEVKPARFIKIPDKPSPVGSNAVDQWQSPLVSPDEKVRLKRERYDEHFAVAEEINEQLENISNDPQKILELVSSQSNRFDNMNSYNALGYLHANLKDQLVSTKRNEIATLSQSLLSDNRFLHLCNLIYKKSRSYPPNACIGNLARFLDLGIPFKTPLIYVFLNQLKNSINDLSVVDAITLAVCISPHASLNLPIALNAGLQALIQIRADEDFDSFASALTLENAYYGVKELNLLHLLKHFGGSLSPTTRNRVLKEVALPLIESGMLCGGKLVTFMSLLNDDWVDSNYVGKCLQALERSTESLTLADCFTVSNICIKFKRFDDNILLGKLNETALERLGNDASTENLAVAKSLLVNFSKINFLSRSLLEIILQSTSAEVFAKEIGYSKVLELGVVHFSSDKEKLISLKTALSAGEMEWTEMDSKAKLLLYYLHHIYKIDVPKLPKEFPSSFESIAEMLAEVTNEMSSDLIIEKLGVLPKLLANAKLCDLKVGESDLSLRMYIPAIDKHGNKFYIVPVGMADMLQNRFDVTWVCRLRFFLLERFLSGSESSISVVPVNLTKFRKLTCDRERFTYVKDCLQNKGDRDLSNLLKPRNIC